MITPLPGHGVSAGALVLLRHAGEGVFNEGEEVLARLFAARAGAALSAARLYAEQASITRTLMRDLLPPQLQPVHGIEFAGGYRASEDYEVVGGDFYDVHPAATADGETLVVLGDVCGKGLEAAMLTGKIRNTLQALTPLAADHQAVLELLNGAMLSTEHCRFATLVLASVTGRDGGVFLRLTSAGHLPPLIVRDGGQVEQADTCGTLIGALPNIEAQSFETYLAPGETCVLYTDGVTEARGGPLHVRRGASGGRAGRVLRNARRGSGRTCHDAGHPVDRSAGARRHRRRGHHRSTPHTPECRRRPYPGKVHGLSPQTADILTARGVPAATLFPALDLLGRQTHDFPRSRRLLAAATSALADRKCSATDPQLIT